MHKQRLQAVLAGPDNQGPDWPINLPGWPINLTVSRTRTPEGESVPAGKPDRLHADIELWPHQVTTTLAAAAH